MSACVGCGGTLRVKRVEEGTGCRRSARRVALGAVLAALLAGCGGQTKTVTGDPPAASLTAAPSTTKAVSPVGWQVAARVKRSVLPVFCSDPDTAVKDFVGTGFRVSDGVVTASHVAADCPPGTTFSFGSGDAEPSRPTRLTTWRSCHMRSLGTQARIPSRRRCGSSRGPHMSVSRLPCSASPRFRCSAIRSSAR